MRTLALCLALAGCIEGGGRSPDPDPDQPPVTDPDDPQPDPQPSEAGRAFFDRHVFPILAAQCGACHEEQAAPSRLGFVAVDPAEAYDLAITSANLVGDFSPSAPIALIPNALHPTQVLDAADHAVILEWLAIECAAQGTCQ